MKYMLPFVLAAGFLWQTLAVASEPANILVEDYTFTRPATWKWEPARSTSSSVNRFAITNDAGKTIADCRFYRFTGSDAALHALLKKEFAEDAQSVTNEVTVNGIRLTYLTLTGTRIYKEQKPRPSRRLVAVLLPLKNDKKIRVGIEGPQAEVDAATADFKNMIEAAVKERAG